jgi:hypothetical protein
MPEAVYILCVLTSALCAGLLWRQYQRGRSRLLLWSSLCFIGLAANNVLLVIDKFLVPTIDLSLIRASTAFAAVGLLVIGLIWDSK